MNKIGVKSEQVQKPNSYVLQAEWTETLDKQLKQVLNKLNSIFQSSLVELNARLGAAGIPRIIIKGKFSLK